MTTRNHSFGMGLALALALAIPPKGILAASPAAPAHWVSTWMAAPMAASPRDVFRNQTLRMIVHTSLGGKQVRVEFSNAFGVRPLVIGAAHVALRARGAAIVSGSDRTLLFDGSPSVTIPPGALELSDPVNLEVPAAADLAVSLYVPGATGPATVHPLALQTGYISGAGDFTAAETLPYKWTTSAWYWLSAVDVEAPGDAHAIVAFGDSITDGYASTPNANRRWPNLLAARFETGSDGGPNLAILDAGISGNRVLHDVAGPSALERFDRDVLGRDGVKYLLVLEGINDLGAPYEPGGHGQQEVTARELIAGLRQLIDRAHAHGIEVFGCTLTPYEGAPYYSAVGEARREAVNRWIRSGGAFDGVIDFDAAVRDPAHPRRFLPAYDSGDHLHPSDAGYQAMADAVNLSLFH